MRMIVSLVSHYRIIFTCSARSTCNAQQL